MTTAQPLSVYDLLQQVLASTSIEPRDYVFVQSLCAQRAAGRSWSVKQRAAAEKICKRYKKMLGVQLVKAAIAVPELTQARVRMIKLADAEHVSLMYERNDALRNQLHRELSHRYNNQFCRPRWTGSSWVVPLNESSARLLQISARNHNFVMDSDAQAAITAIASMSKVTDTDIMMLEMTEGCNITLGGGDLLFVFRDADVAKRFEQDFYS